MILQMFLSKWSVLLSGPRWQQHDFAICPNPANYWSRVCLRCPCRKLLFTTTFQRANAISTKNPSVAFSTQTTQTKKRLSVYTHVVYTPARFRTQDSPVDRIMVILWLLRLKNYTSTQPWFPIRVHRPSSGAVYHNRRDIPFSVNGTFSSKDDFHVLLSVILNENSK